MRQCFIVSLCQGRIRYTGEKGRGGDAPFSEVSAFRLPKTAGSKLENPGPVLDTVNLSHSLYSCPLGYVNLDLRCDMSYVMTVDNKTTEQLEKLGHKQREVNKLLSRHVKSVTPHYPPTKG